MRRVDTSTQVLSQSQLFEQFELPTRKEIDARLIADSALFAAGSPDIRGIYKPDNGSIQYFCADPATRKAALTDGVRNLDPASMHTHTRSIEQVLTFVENGELRVEWVLDTYPTPTY